MSTTPAKGILKTLGTGVVIVAAIVGVIWTAIQIYGFFVAKEPNLTASAECYKFSLPEGTYSKLKSIVTPPDVHDIEKALPDKLDSRSLVALNVQQLLTKDRDLDPTSDLTGLHSRCNFVVANTGGKEAQDLRLQFDQTGFYLLERLGEQDKSDTFTNAIPLGNLHPQSQLTITTWNKDPFLFPPSLTTWKVTYSDGVAPVEFPRPTLAYLLMEHPFKIGGIIDVGLIVILFIAVFGGVTLGRYSRRVRIIKSDSGPDKIELID